MIGTAAHCDQRAYILHTAWSVLLAAAFTAMVLLIRKLYAVRQGKAVVIHWSDHLYEATVVAVFEGAAATFIICTFF